MKARKDQTNEGCHAPLQMVVSKNKVKNGEEYNVKSKLQSPIS
jgi:hypothetical protein